MQRRLVEKLTAAIDKVEATVKQGGDLAEAKQVSHGADGYGWLGSGLCHCGRVPAQIVSESGVSDAMLFAAEYLQADLCDCYPLSGTVAFTIRLQSSRSLTELCVFQLLLSEASDPPAEWLNGQLVPDCCCCCCVYFSCCCQKPATPWRSGWTVDWDTRSQTTPYSPTSPNTGRQSSTPIWRHSM